MSGIRGERYVDENGEEVLTGGLKAAATNKAKYGNNFYANIGRRGGKAGNTGGFASETIGKDGLTGKERAKIAGAKGGRKSKRGPGKKTAAPHLTDNDIQEAKKNKGWVWPFSRNAK